MPAHLDQPAEQLSSGHGRELEASSDHLAVHITDALRHLKPMHRHGAMKCHLEPQVWNMIGGHG